MIVETSRGLVYSSSCRPDIRASVVASPHPADSLGPGPWLVLRWRTRGPGSGGPGTPAASGEVVFTYSRVLVWPTRARWEERHVPHAAIPRTWGHVSRRRVQTGGGDQLSGDCRLTKAASRHGDQGQDCYSLLPPYYAQFPNQWSTSYPLHQK